MQNQLWQLSGISPCAVGILMATWNTKLDVCLLPINYNTGCAFFVLNLNNQRMHKSQLFYDPGVIKVTYIRYPYVRLVDTHWISNLTAINNRNITDHKRRLIISKVNYFSFYYYSSFLFLIFSLLKLYIQIQIKVLYQPWLFCQLFPPTPPPGRSALS